MTDPAVGIDPSLRVDDFVYDLPEELIAQVPLAERDASRLLVLDRATASRHHSLVSKLDDWLEPGDLLVANNSRVIPARLQATKLGTFGQVELLLLREGGDGTWAALAKPARRLRPGTRLLIAPQTGRHLPDVELDVLDVGKDGQVSLAFRGEVPIRLDDYGLVPLPPYIRQRLEDAERYQTVYASEAGSAAAPTAGLHFSPELLRRLRNRGIGWAEVTLHIGLDTFRPVGAQRVADHRIHREWCVVPDESARAVASARRAGRRVVAVGTTSARALETLGARWDEARPAGLATMTELFIVPGYRWQIVDALLTNFHLPRSTLLMMVSSFAGLETIRSAYAEAVERQYRFFSFGDAMLIR